MLVCVCCHAKFHVVTATHIFFLCCANRASISAEGCPVRSVTPKSSEPLFRMKTRFLYVGDFHNSQNSFKSVYGHETDKCEFATFFFVIEDIHFSEQLNFGFVLQLRTILKRGTRIVLTRNWFVFALLLLFISQLEDQFTIISLPSTGNQTFIVN